jgi:hypothetical protein
LVFGHSSTVEALSPLLFFETIYKTFYFQYHHCHLYAHMFNHIGTNYVEFTPSSI